MPTKEGFLKGPYYAHFQTGRETNEGGGNTEMLASAGYLNAHTST